MISLLVCALLAVVPHGREGDAQAFTSITDAQGNALADSRYSQQVVGDRLHIETRSDFADGRVVVERAILRLQPEIEQESWAWSESSKGKLVRSYEVNFRTKKAVATRVDQQKRWTEDVDVEPGHTFAGIGFVVAIKALRAQLKPDTHIKLHAIAMTPKPRSVPVLVSRDGPATIRMAGRSIAADQYTIHPDIPGIVKLFVKAPDQHVWLIAEDPAAFLRFEGPMVEPEDPVIRIDLVPGASPNAARGRAPARDTSSRRSGKAATSPRKPASP